MKYREIFEFRGVPWLNQGWNRYVYPDYRCWIWWADRDDGRAASESSGASSGQWAKLFGAIPRKKSWLDTSMVSQYFTSLSRKSTAPSLARWLPTFLHDVSWIYMKFSFTRLGTVMREFAKNKLDERRKNNLFDAIFARETRKWSN